MYVCIKKENRGKPLLGEQKRKSKLSVGKWAKEWVSKGKQRNTVFTIRECILHIHVCMHEHAQATG